MSYDRTSNDLSIDAGEHLAERVVSEDGFDVIVHYDDVPESDITSVDGIPCTTALRTVIDLAADHGRAELEQMVRHCLERRLFTCEEALARVSQPDMKAHPGAKVLRQIVSEAGITD